MKIIDIISIARPIKNPHDALAAKSFLEELGFKVNLLKADNYRFFAGTESERLEILKQAIYSDSDIIWALYGGYGTAHLLKNLPQSKPEKQKTVIGFSDITSLNLFTYQNWNWRPIHGPFASQLSNFDYRKKDFETLFDILQKKHKMYSIDNIIGNCNIEQSEITGGNLSLIQTGIGTNWQINCENKIVFLEDIDEKAYRIDRMLEHLIQADIITKAKAIVLGEFGKQPKMHWVIENLKDKLRNIPIFTTNAFGHFKHNVPIVYGAKAEIINSKMNIYLD